MSRKKQGSLMIARSPRTQLRSLDTVRDKSNIKSTSKVAQRQTYEIDDIIGFIENYQFLKQSFQGNSNTIDIYEQQTPSDTMKEEDLQFCFDVDLGVPYVQSHHLDSGFEYEDKSQQERKMSFPKISSAKQIFTSVLQLEHTKNSQCLEEQNFTDQQQQSESSFCIRKSAAFNKKKSRKHVPVMLDNESQFTQQDNQVNFTVPDNSVCQSSIYLDNQSIVERLKSTVLSRENKLQYWNQRLIQLQDGSHNQTSQYNISIHSTSHNKSQSKLSLSPSSHQQHVKKKSKFQKNPIKKAPTKTMVVQVNLNKNKQNITPSRLKLQTKIISNAKLTTIKEKNNLINNRLESNQKLNLLNVKQSSFKDNKLSNTSKDRSLMRKVF